MYARIAKILFENKKNVISYIIVYMVFVLLIGVATMLLAKQLNQSFLPDIEVSGRLDPDGVFRYKYFNDVEGLAERYVTALGNSARVYGVTSRCFLTYQDTITFQKLNFLLYGVEDKFLSEVSSYLKRGRLPEKGKKEALVGEYAAQYFETDIGEQIDVHVTLNKDFVEEDKGQYIVSGIIDENLDYFKSAVIISKETFEDISQTRTKNNIVWIYFQDNNGITKYHEVFPDFGKLQSETLAGSIHLNYFSKQNSQSMVLINMLMFLISGVLIFYTLLSYMFKGITKKIGLLKALGIPDKHIIWSFLVGFGACSLFSTIIGLVATYGIKYYINDRLSNSWDSM